MAVPESVIDFNKICRLCLSEGSFMSSIYDNQEKHSTPIPLALRIMACVSIELNSVDGLPSHICTTCLCQVNGWYRFKHLCETADAILKKFIKNEPVHLNTISQIRENAQEIQKIFQSPYVFKVEGIDSTLGQTRPAAESMEEKDFESCDGDLDSKTKEVTSGVNLNDKCELNPEKNSKYELVSKLKDQRNSNCNIENDNKDEKDEELFNNEDDQNEDQLKRKIKNSSNIKDFSLDKDLSLFTKNEMILQERNGNQKAKIKVQETLKRQVANSVRCIRTIKMQTKLCENEEEEEEEDNEKEVEVIVTEINSTAEKKTLDKKKLKSRKTQTPKDSKSDGKKRFRVRPAVPSSCTLCDKVYKNSEILRQHMKSHHVTGTIECSNCKLTFLSLRSLKYHEQRKHSNLEPVPCTFCGKKFLDKKYLRIHENIHSQANQFVCQFCGRKFIMKTNLTVHISRHHTQKSNDFICQICGKAFPFKLYLKKHFKTHTDHKPYQCSRCEAKFRENTLLQKHINSIHLKLRPFLCQYCHKTFTRGLYLREHMESQHMGIQKKVECSKCKKSFQNRNRLRQHECLNPV